MRKNSLICSSAIYQKVILLINWEQFSLNSVRLNPAKLVPRIPLKVSLILPLTKVLKKLLKLSVWKKLLTRKLSWYSNTSTKKKVKSKDHPTKSLKTWATSINQTSSLNTSQKQLLWTNSKISLANAVPFFQQSLRIISFMSRMRRLATTKRDTFYTRMWRWHRKVSRTTMRLTFSDSEDQLRLTSGDPRQILNNKMTLLLNKTFCNSLIFKDKITEITTQWIKWELQTITKVANNKTGTTITEQSKTKIEEEVKEITEVEVVIAINVEVITTRIRTWINNIILINQEEMECISKEVKWIWEACLNHQCKTDQSIHSKWTRSSSSQEHHSKFRWINRLSNCHKLTLANLMNLRDNHNNSQSLSETASMDLFNKPSEMSLLQELLVCSLMRTLELISPSFWQIISTSPAKSMKPIISSWAPNRDETPLSHLRVWSSFDSQGRCKQTDPDSHSSF